VGAQNIAWKRRKKWNPEWGDEIIGTTGLRKNKEVHETLSEKEGSKERW
jgi:hypothetical protein